MLKMHSFDMREQVTLTSDMDERNTEAMGGT